MSKPQTIYKYQAAEMLGVSMRTLSRWLNERYFEELKTTGYSKHQRILLPKQIEILQVKLDI